VRVCQVDGGYRVEGDWDGRDSANAFLAHLGGRGFSAATANAQFVEFGTKRSWVRIPPPRLTQ
jgi:hypothetical protein